MHLLCVARWRQKEEVAVVLGEQEEEEEEEFQLFSWLAAGLRKRL